MEILLYVSAIIAALSLLLIAIFIVITLKNAKQTMNEVSETLKRVETKIGGITDETEKLMNKTNQIAENAETKLEAFNGLSQSAKNLSSSSHYLNESIQSVSNQIKTPPEQHVKIMKQASILTEVLARAYYRFQQADTKKGPKKNKEKQLKRLPEPQKQIEHRS